jgi:hypothetical protein
MKPPKADGSPQPKKYFAATSLRELVMQYSPHEKTKANVGQPQPAAVLTPEEAEERTSFLDFMSGMLQASTAARGF